MKRSFLLNILLSGIATIVLSHMTAAQVYSGIGNNPKMDQYMRRSMVEGVNPYRGIDGSPFFPKKEFTKGTIYHKDSTKTVNVPMRLNHYDDQIEFKHGEDIMMFIEPEEIESFEFGHLIFIYSKFDPSIGKPDEGFLEVMAKGYCKLLLRRSSEVKREDLPVSDFSGGNYRDYFRINEEYYIKKGDKPAKNIRKSKRKILKELGDHTNELKDYIKENNLRLKTDQELIDLIYYYNALISEKD